MGYVSKRGRRPDERASKASHSHIINDSEVAEFLNKCSLPKHSTEVEIPQTLVTAIEPPQVNPIQHIVAIDGGYTEVFVKKEFPSSTIAFFQLGALIFDVSDLNELSRKPFIDPDDIEKLKNLQRLKLALPTKNIALLDEESLTRSIRKTLDSFFKREPKGEPFIETLKWFVFEEYGDSLSQWHLATCPNSDAAPHGVTLVKDEMQKDYTFQCSQCGESVFLTDVFRLHEAIDDELGAGGILGYLITLVEQIMLVHLIRIILKTKPSLLEQTLFIKDGPLAFFGQTANMHRPMRNLANYLDSKHNLYLAGLEKTGSFVEHADEVSSRLKPGEIMLLDNEYIYRYIIPGKADPQRPYARSSYYGGKLIYKSRDEQVYVVTIPVAHDKVVLSPKKSDYRNIDVVLANIERLKCDMYDSSLVPVALVNKLVSLADHPSSIILEKFAKESFDGSN